MSVTIVKPTDWATHRSERLTVVLDGIEGSGHKAQLFPADRYLGGQHPAPLATVPVEPLPGGVGRAVFDGVEAWGRCVIRIVTAAGAECAVSGVQLAHSGNTAWLSEPPPPPEGEGFAFPLQLVHAAQSHSGGPVRLEATVVPSLRELVSQPPADAVRLALLSAPRGIDGLEAMALPFCLGTEDPAFKAMLERRHRVTNEPYIARFRGAIGGMPSGLVLSREGAWSDSTITLFFTDGRFVTEPGLFRARGLPGYCGGAASSRRILDANGVGHFPGIPMLLANTGWRNHAHWIINSMLPAFCALEELKAGWICLLVPEYQPSIFESLMALGIPRRAILVAPPGLYHFDDLLFPSTLSTHVNRAMPPAFADMVQALRAHGRRAGGGRGPRLVYFTRQGSGAARRIGNEAALIEGLRARGFAIVAPHELDFLAEIRCVADAAVVVGQLGAALVNASFAPPGAWLVELASANYLSDDYWVQASVLNQRFVRLLTPTPTGDGPELGDFTFDVDLPATLQAIDRVVAAASTGQGEARG